MTARDRTLELAPADVMDYRELARRRLPRQLFDYIDGGAYAENTLRENVAALRGLRLRQRVLRDVSQIDLSAQLFGQSLRLPLILAPVGLAGMFARRAEVQAARAAELAGIPFCESTVSICSLEEVAGALASPPWFQLYVMRDRNYAEQLMERATRAGCPVLVLTVDLAVVGTRHRDVRNGTGIQLGAGKQARKVWDYVSHPRWLLDVALRGRPLTFGNLSAAVPNARMPGSFRQWVDAQWDASVTWDDLAWVRRHWSGKIVLKGILDPQDAQRAVDAGMDGIIVSNHGGRQLDDVHATAHILPRVLQSVGDRIPVLVDGGIRSGLDVVKMLALGARACLLGRAWAYAVAAAGQAGVSHVLSMMNDEMRVAMALTGSCKLSDLTAQTLDDP
ncbi:MAG TPA: L-lactate dehydrogenase [Polyangiales bacterium]|nr:L-lactate dehydrogenase [Polyangiales bacterium]